MIRGGIMLRGLIIAIALLMVTVSAQAQVSAAVKDRGFTTFNLSKAVKDGIKPLADNDIFISPNDSLLKLQRQVEFHMLPAGFLPAEETETDAFKRKALRYAIAYYRDSEVPGFADFRDVILGLRLDTRN